MAAIHFPKARYLIGPKVSGVGGPRPVYAEHRADFLTMVMEDGEAELQDFVSYSKRSPEHRARIRAAHVKAGMTRYAENTCQDALDWLKNPAGLVPYLKELYDDGLGPILLVGLEDAPRMQAEYRDIGKFTNAIQNAFAHWAPLTAEVWLGVEVNEYWTETEVREVLRAVRSVFEGPIAVHYGSGQRGGDWGAKRAAGATHFAYQSPHPAVEDQGQGFLADPTKIKADLASVVAYVKGQVKVIASEYAYFGRNPSKSIVATISARGASLGSKALEVAGIVGISNGGPGYWPPQEFELPPAGVAVDAVDINTVRFYTRAGVETTSRLRRWPIESVLKGSISGSHIYYDHSASLTWPRVNNVSGASWIGFLVDGVWKMYTNDYLRPGNAAKEWPKLAALNGEPIHRTAKHGETILMMASRIDPRLNDYPVGEGRSQIVTTIVP